MIQLQLRHYHRIPIASPHLPAKRSTTRFLVRFSRDAGWQQYYQVIELAVARKQIRRPPLISLDFP
ncbi:hypothetical protein ACLK15_16650 [Escherichia coli]